MFWVCTQEDNLYMVDLYTNNIPHYTIDSTGVNVFYEESDSVFWYGEDSGLVRKDLKNGSTHRFVNDSHNSNSISNNVVGDILKDNHGNFWLATQGGLNRFNPNTRMFTRFQHNLNDNESLSSDKISVLYEDRESNLWVGTYGYGLDLMNSKTGKFSHYKNNPTDTNSLSQNFVANILEDQTQDLWIGTWNNGGVNRMNRQTGNFKNYLPGVNINAMYKDSDGIIWVGAENGLYRYNRKSDNFSSMAEENAGIDITNIKSLIGDDQNNLWIGSSFGIFRLNQKRDQIIFYGKENGVNAEILYFGSAYKGMDGELFFGDYNGYYAFYPNKLKIGSIVPKINFTNFWLNGQVITPANKGPLQEPLFMAKEIHLHYDQNVFSVGFTAIDYGNPENKKVYCKLENYDKDWHQPGTEDRVYYFNVPPGKYIFRIKASNNNNGIWTEKDISVIITSPWWTRWWAYCIYGLLFIILGYSIHRFQKERLIKVERERTRARELTQAKEIEKSIRGT